MSSSFKVVVVGGVAAGMKAACKTARLRPDAEIVVIERGDLISYSGCGLPYFISGVVHKREELYSTPIGVERNAGFFENVKNVKVLTRHEAVKIDRAEKSLEIRNLDDGSTRSIPYDKLVLGTGAVPVVPPVPGHDLGNVFTVKQVEDADRISSNVEKDSLRKAVIVGGGLIGVEMAECLADLAMDVTVVEMLPQILPMLDPEIALLVQNHLDEQGVTVSTGSAVTALEGEGGRVTAVKCGDRSFEADLVIFAIGVRPASDLAREAGLDIGPFGGIRVDDRMWTSDPDIYAAGDCVEAIHLVTGKPAYVPLGSTANKQGRVAAKNLCGEEDTFQGIIGSAVVKICDFNVARTGLSEREAFDAGLEPIACLCPAPDKTHFFPGANPVLLKLVADRNTGRLLGAQAVGPGDVSKRVDSVVPAITAGMTVEQVSKLDLCYAPPYASAMDNVITAANVLRNKMEGRMNGIPAAEVREKLEKGEDFFFLDARSPGEVAEKAITGATNIPLGKLRSALDEVPADKPVVCFCALSLRGYEAALILEAAGRSDVTVMDGGVAMWPY